MKLRAPPRLRSIALALACGLALSCATPDPDAAPGGAGALAPGTAVTDSVGCPGGDCRDWFRVPVGAAGRLVVEVRAQGEGSVELVLADGRARTLVRERSGPAGTARIDYPVEPGAFLVAVVDAAGQSSVLDRVLARGAGLAYRLEASLVRERRPQVVYRTVSAEVLELEAGDPPSVLLGAGTRDGLRPGVRGELRDGERLLAEIEVVDVYEEGSRARLDGPLRAPITPSARAELQVPERR